MQGYAIAGLSREIRSGVAYPYDVPRGLLQSAEAEEELNRSLVRTERLRVLDRWPIS
jgi:hypothetical protein